MKLDLAAILSEPEKHVGALTRVEDVVTEKLAPAPVKVSKADPAVEGETDLEAATRSLKRRHPHIHRKMLNLD